jgi:HEAT repeat protein
MKASRPSLFLAILLFAPLALRAGSSGAGVEAWSGIEADMRNEGCFKPPIATPRAALRSEDPLCRFRAVRLLGLKGEREAISEIKALQESDPAPFVRSQAAVELVRLGERGYLDEARKILDETSDPVSRVSLAGQLADVGDPSGFRHVEDASRAPQAELRRMGLAVLVFFRQDELAGKVADLYLDLADDPVEDLRRSAAYGLADLSRRRSLPPEALLRLENLAAGAADPKVREIAAMAVEEQKRRKPDSKEKQR